jgi:hypothetical protein
MTTEQRATRINPREVAEARLWLRFIRQRFFEKEWIVPSGKLPGKMWLESRSKGYRCKLWKYEAKKAMTFLNSKANGMLPAGWVAEISLENRRNVDPRAYYGKGIHIFVDKIV